MKDEWNIKKEIDHTDYDGSYVRNDKLEILRKKLIEDFFEEFEWLPQYNDEELREIICKIVNKCFGVKDES